MLHALGSIFFALFQAIVFVAKLLVPPLTLWGLVVLVPLSFVIAFRLRDEFDELRQFLVRWFICLIVTSVVWNSVAWLFRPEPPADFSDNPAAVLEKASQLVKKVNDTREGVASTHAKLTALVAKTSWRTDPSVVHEAQQKRPSAAEMLQIINELIEEGEVVLQLHSTLLESIRAYSGLLPEAQRACLEAAERQRQRAEEEEYAELEQSYLAVARYFDAMAEEIGRSAGDIVQPENAVQENAEYVKHAIAFLRQFRKDLQAIPEFPGTEMQKEVMNAIQRFVLDFERFRQTLEDFGKAIPSKLPKSDSNNRVA